MGVSGCGKSSIGRTLAQRLGYRFFDADDFHSPANLDKMRQEIPLSDEDRIPWLARLRSLLEKESLTQNVVLSCSALRESYRRQLLDGLPNTEIIHLTGSFDLILQRLKAREAHFMPASLLHSQFESLEPPDEAITLDVAAAQADIVAEILKHLKQKGTSVG